MQQEDDNQVKKVCDNKKEKVVKMQPMLNQLFRSDKVTINMMAEDMKKYLVGLVVRGGVSLRLFESEDFMAFNGQMVTKLGISLSRDVIRDYVMKEYNEKYQALKEELTGKLLYPKIDACTRHNNKNYFAINAQYIDTEDRTRELLLWV